MPTLETVQPHDYSSMAVSPQCYDSVISCGDSGSYLNGQLLYHMDHNLAALIFGEGGLVGPAVGATVTSSSGIQIQHLVSGTTSATSMTENYVATNQSKGLIAALKEDAASEDPQLANRAKDIIQKIIDLYCNTIYLADASNEAYLDHSKYKIVSAGTNPPANNTASDAALYKSWDDLFNDGLTDDAGYTDGDPKNLLEVLKTESTSATARINMTKEQTYEDEVQLWKGEWSEIYNNYEKYLNNSEAMKDNVKTFLDKIPPEKIPNESDPKAQWYTNLWYRMGGLGANDTSNNKYTMLDDSKMSNAAWLQYALETGVVALEQVVFSDSGSALYPGLTNADWKSASYQNATDISSQDDEQKIAKADAKYQRTTADIQTKDKQYDMDLKKLDTQHNALQTEFDSIKTIISKNAERSFKAFS